MQFFLSNNVKLAIKLKLDGVYLPSFNKNFSHLAYNFKKKFIILGSAHSLKELNIKKIQGVKIFFISSLFKKNKNYLGIYKFKFFENFTKKKLVALGGINEKNIKKLRIIKYFWIRRNILFSKKKAPLKKGPFNFYILIILECKCKSELVRLFIVCSSSASTNVVVLVHVTSNSHTTHCV